MRKISVTALLVVIITALTGCGGTIDLNKAITGTECSTREECLKDLQINNSGETGIVIVIEPFHIDSWGKSYLGNRPVDSAKLVGDSEVCLIKYINEKMPTATIVLGGKDVKGDIYISIRDAGMDGIAPYTPRWYMDFAASIKGKDIKDRVSYVKFMPFSASSFTSYAYPAICNKLISRVLAEMK